MPLPPLPFVFFFVRIFSTALRWDLQLRGLTRLNHTNLYPFHSSCLKKLDKIGCYTVADSSANAMQFRNVSPLQTTKGALSTRQRRDRWLDIHSQSVRWPGYCDHAIVTGGSAPRKANVSLVAHGRATQFSPPMHRRSEPASMWSQRFCTSSILTG